ncbi:hypothetical protein LEL_05367 [Akanthomyces lecanii RCEF 1005]|uniref:Uncharacterized protein n=1 Tax=Akanthomyces lecanii RCEF 1005 TaxID=1081108 RepID=A0A168I037_CORDF|nr:hypothetical protein LEL_05367 [Akanthomyces lecanii RCEF 1005]
MDTQHAFGDLGAKISFSLGQVLTSEEKLTRFYIAVLTAGVASTLPIAFLNEPLTASNRPSARLSRLKLYGYVLLMVVEATLLASWYLLPTFYAAKSPAAALVKFAVACVTGPAIDMEAKRPHSWLLSSIFLVLAGFGPLCLFAN